MSVYKVNASVVVLVWGGPGDTTMHVSLLIMQMILIHGLALSGMVTAPNESTVLAIMENGLAKPYRAIWILADSLN